jgi:hypothetical protein
MHIPTVRRTAAALAVAGALFVVVASAQSNAAPERFTANAFDVDRGNVTPIQIVIDRWTGEAERDRLITTLLDKGQDAALEALQKAPTVGYIRSTTSLGWDLHFAQRQPWEDGGERVVVATDRPMGFWETVNQPRTVDYPFTIVEMRVNANGEGSGMLSYATKIIPDKEGHIITLENWGTQQIRLNQVKRETTSQ